jgi:hypothetical protein
LKSSPTLIGILLFSLHANLALADPQSCLDFTGKHGSCDPDEEAREDHAEPLPPLPEPPSEVTFRDGQAAGQFTQAVPETAPASDSATTPAPTAHRRSTPSESDPVSTNAH